MAVPIIPASKTVVFIALNELGLGFKYPPVLKPPTRLELFKENSCAEPHLFQKMNMVKSCFVVLIELLVRK